MLFRLLPLHIVLLSSLLVSCGSASFSGAAPGDGGKSSTSSNGEGVGNTGGLKSSGELAQNKIAVAGASLDLYAIVDVSGSLKVTDPLCTRLEALKAFFSDLKATLGDNTDARLSLTVFSTSATFVGTDEKFLSLSAPEFDAKYRSKICSTNKGTNIAGAFTITKREAERLMSTSPKKISSVLVFTDGQPTDAPSLHEAAAAQLRSVFPDRVFGILLGGSSGAIDTSSNVTADDPEAFMTMVTGSRDRVRRVSKVEGLAAALSSFLK